MLNNGINPFLFFKIMTHSDQRAYYFKIDSTLKKIRSFMQKQLNAAQIDLTVDQWVLMDHIQPNPGINQNDLAKITCKDAPTTTRILDILVKKGFVARKNSEVDRRKFELFLTNQGKLLHTKAQSVIVECRKKTWERLDNQDYERLVHIMDTINTNID